MFSFSTESNLQNMLKLFIKHDGGKTKPNGVMIPIPQYPLYSASTEEFGLYQVSIEAQKEDYPNDATLRRLATTWMRTTTGACRRQSWNARSPPPRSIASRKCCASSIRAIQLVKCCRVRILRRLSNSLTSTICSYSPTRFVTVSVRVYGERRLF